MAEEEALPNGLRARPDEQALAAAAALLHHCQSLVLASADDTGEALASYAPYVVADGAVHVFVSRLAAHSSNLARGGVVSMMVIEDEARARQAFARVRLVVRASVAAVAGEEAGAAAVLDAMDLRFGAVVATLRQLPDFQLYRLTPLSARFVQGFGQAFVIEGADLAHVLEHARHPRPPVHCGPSP